MRAAGRGARQAQQIRINAVLTLQRAPPAARRGQRAIEVEEDSGFPFRSTCQLSVYGDVKIYSNFSLMDMLFRIGLP